MAQLYNGRRISLVFKSPMWRIFLKDKHIDVLIFVVDSNDRDRISDCRDELGWFLRKEAYANCVLLVLANKQDLPNAMSIQEITEKLELNTLKDRLWCKCQCGMFSVYYEW